jgi:hypothetical protein
MKTGFASSESVSDSDPEAPSANVKSGAAGPSGFVDDVADVVSTESDESFVVVDESAGAAVLSSEIVEDGVDIG